MASYPDLFRFLCKEGSSSLSSENNDERYQINHVELEYIHSYTEDAQHSWWELHDRGKLHLKRWIKAMEFQCKLKQK